MNSFRVRALPDELFRPLFQMSDAELQEQGAKRMVADACPSFPCRVSMEDAAIGETVLLLEYQHQPVETPYRASGAIYVRENAKSLNPAPGEIPEVLRRRLLSLRAYDEAGYMVEADVVEGRDLEQAIAQMFAKPEVAYLHLHHAKQGCYACRVDRARLDHRSKTANHFLEPFADLA